MSRTVVAISAALAVLAPLTPAMASIPPEFAQNAATTGRNAVSVSHSGGRLVLTGGGKWTEYDGRGQPIYYFEETGRDDWSVYLADRSRGVQLQLDLYRGKILYSENSGLQTTLYTITGASSPPPRPAPSPQMRQTRDVNAGPIWNQDDANTKCPVAAFAVGGSWTGQWRTTVQGQMSVCQIEF